MKQDKKTLLEFPCEVPIKAFGKNIKDFEGTVVDLIGEIVSAEAIVSRHSHESKHNAYLAVTVTVYVEEYQTLEQIYTALYEHTDVLMTL